jgi:transposase
MSEITLIGIDLAKNIFRIHCVERNGKRIMNKNLCRDRLIHFFAPLPECTVAMEACAGSHHWGRAIESLGHTVKLIHPRYVSPYRLGDKNDANDAAAICAAAQRPDMRFVRLHSQRQSDIQGIHRVRQGLIKEWTATINRCRGLLAENGIVIKQSATAAYTQIPIILGNEETELSGIMRQLLRCQYEHLQHLRGQIREIERMLRVLVEEDENCRRLMQVPGFGLITATLLASELGNGSAFHNSRSFAAYLGLTPKQNSSGGKQTLLGISKRGDTYLRALLINGARAVLRAISLGKTHFGGGTEKWVQGVMERRGKIRQLLLLPQNWLV